MVTSKVEEQLVSEIARLREELAYWKEQSTTDALTGIGNRKSFDDDLLHTWQMCSRLSFDISVIYFDLDGLKAANDNIGHSYGDEFIKQVANAVKSSIREYDKLSRWGGDEFAVILPMTSKQDALSIADRIRLVVASLRDGNGRFYGTASIGMATSKAVFTTPEKLVNSADIAQKQAKQSGKNRVCTC
jgi:diguanylate cyclase (GGDEF)-like protein